MFQLEIAALDALLSQELAVGAEDGLAFELAASLKAEAASASATALQNLPPLKQALLDYAVGQFARYLVAESWDHIFQWGGQQQVRFVYDRATQQITTLQRHRSGKWLAAAGADIADVLDSLKNGNPELMDNPESYGLLVQPELPDWAE